MLTDNEVMAAILKSAHDQCVAGYEPARRIVERDHYRLLYQRNPVDTAVNSAAADAVFEAACKRFGDDKIRRDSRPAKSEGVDFPVLTKDQRVASSITMSEALQQLPAAAFDFVFVEGGLRKDAEKWLKDERAKIIQAKESEETDGSTAA